MATYTADIDVRFRDIDAMGHVNNAVYATYIEQARTRFFRDVLDLDISGASTVLASLSIDFRRPVELDDDAVAVSVEIADLGRSSATMTHEIRIGDAVAAEAEATLVAVDPETGEPTPIPEAHREAMASYRDR
ncbi:thioesterase family protein [Halorubrum ezzemoulense]|jgi:acyl-CoA thioester hydrolase|uniref:Acyl-CoA thioester hydrolase n=1 Tax=Halorubrum ezzemoulense TaxID=337243 RepID=A0A256JMY8_HALEZ|nr:MULTISPECIES: thioesterase family protein [Halorubrum]MDB2223295.1 thioesterase family protein [Halorubrum ezzemoulense]MDB2237739.1 thioesterase family protein [Halorubrum ezzemoulense]MDB2243460.1 thioesterase family protein [Halorubrum ezzemoulense]MDB2248767.1 thioesterase family protein [Halorubrum ezzemoulense]MDB2251526.1 thioesterase family protein [Halorubrum ezzemoulense]